MANYTYLYQENGEIDTKELINIIDEINNEKFDSVFDINIKNNSIILLDGDIYLCIVKDIIYDHIKTKTVLRFKNTSNHFHIWLQSYFIYEVHKRMKLSVYDEGIGQYQPLKPQEEFINYLVTTFLRNGSFFKKLLLRSYVKKVYRSNKDFYKIENINIHNKIFKQNERKHLSFKNIKRIIKKL
jgi:hypothetical protein